MQQIAAPGITDVILSVDTTIPKNILAAGRIAQIAGTLLKRRCTSIMERTSSISKNLKTLLPICPPNVQGVVSLSLWVMIAIPVKEMNIGVKNVPTRK
jgi:predicted short-subunit dehydrogenase-like oxidoreductase (DUF2520 family)